MNLPLEVQRRLDRRWFARFGMPEQRSTPRSAVARLRSKPDLWDNLPIGAACALIAFDDPERSKIAEDLAVERA